MFFTILSYICMGYATLVILCLLYLGVNFYFGREEKIRRSWLFQFFARYFKLILGINLVLAAVTGKFGWFEVFLLLFALVFYGLCILGDGYLERLEKKNDPGNDDY